MAAESKPLATLLAEYAAGAELLKKSVAGLTPQQLLARPIPCKWSIHEVVCHLSDAESLYADRIKRVLAEERPTLQNLDPDPHVARLSVPERDIGEELQLVDLIRKQMGRILAAAPAADFQRIGNHTESGPLTIETLLSRIVGHIPHHVKFIEEKRKALGALLD